jgi:hypothetical protein
MKIRKRKQFPEGKHPGGPKPIYGENMIKVTLYIPKYQYDHVLQVAGDGHNFAQAVRVILDKDIDNANPN